MIIHCYCPVGIITGKMVPNSFSVMCSYLVKEVISHYESSGNSVFCIVLDDSKAFERPILYTF